MRERVFKEQALVVRLQEVDNLLHRGFGGSNFADGDRFGEADTNGSSIQNGVLEAGDRTTLDVGIDALVGAILLVKR